MRAAICKTPGCRKHAQYRGWCRKCGRASGFREQELAVAVIERRQQEMAKAQRVSDLQNVPYDATYHGEFWTVIWAGRGALPGMGETPRQLGCSLLDVSRVIR